MEHLDGSRTVTTYPTYDRLIAATFESVTAKTRAFNALTKEPPAKVKTKRVTSWNGYVYGAIGMAEQDQFAADIRKPGADIEALKAAMVDRARNYFRDSYESESAVYGMIETANVEIDNLKEERSAA